MRCRCLSILLALASTGLSPQGPGSAATRARDFLSVRSNCPTRVLSPWPNALDQIQRVVHDYLRSPRNRPWPDTQISDAESLKWNTYRVYEQSGPRQDAVAMCGKLVTNKSWLVVISPHRPDPKVAWLVYRLYLARTGRGWRVWAACGPSCFHA